MTGLVAGPILALVLGPARATDPEPAGPIAVVVGRESPARDVTLDTLRELYLRRQRVWDDGSRVMPVNLPVDTPVRQAFSERVLGRQPRDLVGYWNRMWFEGIRPPLVLRTAAAVCAYLAVEPTAIGYVAADEVDDKACRVVLVLRER